MILQHIENRLNKSPVSFKRLSKTNYIYNAHIDDDNTILSLDSLAGGGMLTLFYSFVAIALIIILNSQLFLFDNTIDTKGSELVFTVYVMDRSLSSPGRWKVV